MSAAPVGGGDDWFAALFGPSVVEEAENNLKAHDLIQRVSNDVVSEMRTMMANHGLAMNRDWEDGARAAIGLTFARWNAIVREVQELTR